MSATTTHTAFCDVHTEPDQLDPTDPGTCTRILEPVEGYTIEVFRNRDGIVAASPYTRRDEFTASEAQRIAQGFMEAARIIDGAALPEGTGTTLDVAAVAMLAQIDQFDVRQAINAGTLTAHKAVDGTPRLLVEFTEATTWAKARATAALPCDGWASCPTPGHKHDA